MIKKSDALVSRVTLDIISEFDLLFISGRRPISIIIQDNVTWEPVIITGSPLSQIVPLE